MGSKRDLPFVYINVATTADGKLAPANRHFVPFGSKRDQELLLELRACADAVMSGARTVGPMPVNLGPGPAKFRRMRVRQGLPEYNLRVVVSGSANLNPRAEIFRHRFSPIIILVTRRALDSKVRRLRDAGAEVMAFGEKELNFTEALRWLRKKWGVKKLLCEGGGEVNAGLFQEELVDEVYHTLCPLVFGGRNAPTMSDGNGFPNLASAAKFRLKSLKRVGDELFLIWKASK